MLLIYVEIGLSFRSFSLFIDFLLTFILFCRHEATPGIWQETYVSALLRAIRYADDPNYRLAG